MFYAHIILAQKGPLARIWLAAHWDKKITKAHVFETNIEKSVEGIMQPKVKLALRTSGHLLLGVVRIYSRKAKYLLADCNEAFVKIKMAFRPGMVDLPEGHREANVNAITLPEVFHDFDTALPELNDIDIEAQFSINQSRAEEITMREDYGSLSLSLHDDGFGDIGFENDGPELIRGTLEPNIHDHLFQDEIITNPDETFGTNIKIHDSDLSMSKLDGDGFGDEFGQPQLFEDDLFSEPQICSTVDKMQSVEQNREEESCDEDLAHFSPQPSSPASSHHSYSTNHIKEEKIRLNDVSVTDEKDNIEKVTLEQSTLLQNEEESFALAPIDASALKGVTKTKRKRKLIVDEVKNISGEEMKAQLANTSDIVTTLDLAPPTKRLMYWKETGGVEKLFSLPSRVIPARTLFANYHRHLLSHITQLEDFSCLGPNDLLALDQIQNENETCVIHYKRGRRRKIDVLNNMNSISNTVQSIAVPEVVRDHENSPLSRISIDIAPNECIQENDSRVFESLRSPDNIFSLNDEVNAQGMEQIDFSFGSCRENIQSNDLIDDFNNGDSTPAELNHGQLTPHHSGIESIESIPNLPTDQISTILSEAEIINNSKLPDRNLQQPANISSDWNDYDFSTIGVQNTYEEQMLENETNEQFEERVLNKRAAQMFYTVKARFVKHECILLSELTYKNTRKQAAQKFYSLLVLKKFRALNISQSEPYSDILISRGPMFENPNL